MKVKIFDLPTRSDPLGVIERQYVELVSAKRNGVVLDEILLDWMDTANTWLIEASMSTEY